MPFWSDTKVVLHFLAKFVRHGQIFCLYPGAFASEAERYQYYAEHDSISRENIEITTEDGVKLHCFYIPAQPTKEVRNPPPTVIMFHGNGYHAWEFLDCCQSFSNLGCNTYLIEYRGYGANPGAPSEKGLRRDAQAALEYVLARRDPSEPLPIIFGPSLGGAVAIDLAYRNPDKVSALILENTFLSVPSVVKDIPLLKRFVRIVHQKWDSASKIGHIPPTVPILMIRGFEDLVIPRRHMEGLWEIARNRRLKDASGTEEGEETIELRDMFFACPGTHESTWCSDVYWEKIDEFITSVFQ